MRARLPNQATGALAVCRGSHLPIHTIKETITFGRRSPESDKWAGEQHSESEMTSIKCKWQHVSRFSAQKCKLASQQLFCGDALKEKYDFFFFFGAFLEGRTQTQLHTGSSLIASCGSVGGKSSSAQTCFSDDCTKLPHARFFCCPAWPASAPSNPSRSGAFLYYYFCPETYEKKDKNKT